MSQEHLFKLMTKIRDYVTLAATLLRAKVALFTSGLGTHHGGVGVVAQHIVSALPG